MAAARAVVEVAGRLAKLRRRVGSQRRGKGCPWRMLQASRGSRRDRAGMGLLLRPRTQPHTIAEASGTMAVLLDVVEAVETVTEVGWVLAVAEGVEVALEALVWVMAVWMEAGAEVSMAGEGVAMG